MFINRPAHNYSIDMHGSRPLRAQRGVRMRNVLTDYYMSEINEFNRVKFGREIRSIRLPVMRIFGIRDDGSKCCAHIHGYLPSIVFRTGRKATEKLKQHLESIIRHIAETINSKGLLKNDPAEAIFYMHEEKGRSVYGYYPEEEYFLRVYLYDPELTRLCVVALQQGCLRREYLQPYNAHVPFVLQFFIDFSLFGMDFVDFSHVHARTDAVSTQSSSRDMTAAKNSPLRRSCRGSFEYDVYTESILNPSRIHGEFENPGLNFIWEEERARSHVLGVHFDEIYGTNAENGRSPTEGDEAESSHYRRLREVLIKLAAYGNVKRNEALEVEINRDEMLGMEQDVILALERSPSPLDAEEQEEAEDVLWENRTLQLMGFKVEEDEEAGDHNGGVDGDQACIILDDQQEAPDFVQLEDENDEGSEEEEEFENRKLKCRGTTDPVVVPDMPPVRLDGHRRHYDLMEDPNLDKGSPRDRLQESWLADETIIDEPSQIENSPQAEEQTAGIDMESERRLMNAVQSNVSHLSAMSMEILAVPPRVGRSIADPLSDQVLGVFFSFDPDVCSSSRTKERGGIVLGRLAEAFPLPQLIYVDTEHDLFEELSRTVQKLDPDILLGYDTARFSWGYLFERANALKRPFLLQISRVVKGPNRLQGRMLFECWRTLRHDSPLKSYQFQDAALSILGLRVPCFSSATLIEMLDTEEPGARATIFRHLICRTAINIELLKRIDMFVRTCQMARVIGIQFREVIGRGSQYRVESMLLRLAKRLRFYAPSVTPEQRNLMASPETIPLNLEPESGVYRDPVVVLDFQSLYPSILIAHNYCFSTCLGKVANWESASKSLSENETHTILTLGALKYGALPTATLSQLLESHLVHLSPAGGIFVKRQVRRSLLATLLQELLDTRVMVKKAMKRHKNCRNLLRLLEARQLALKLVANVTYGYTAANWSGRMPCEEVADAIVAKGREALERAIALVRTASKATYSGARVIYGDTDSLFILLEGCSKDEAFRIGHQIAEDVTALNPRPVKLKFEKVMMPCALLAKKRYVGMCYETPEQAVGVLESKGIETIRRDACEFVSNGMKKVLVALFEHSLDAALLCLRGLLTNVHTLPLSDFVISTEYRGHYDEDALLPINKIANGLIKLSPRLAPVRGERLGYLVMEPTVKGAVSLTSCVVSVDNFLSSTHHRLHLNYYVLRKLFPVLERVFELEAVQLRWNPSSFRFCIGCGSTDATPWCNDCLGDPRSLRPALLNLLHTAKLAQTLRRTCRTCIAPSKAIKAVRCENFGCPINQQLIAANRTLARLVLDQHTFYGSIAEEQF